MVQLRSSFGQSAWPSTGGVQQSGGNVGPIIEGPYKFHQWSNLGTCSPISPQPISYWFNPHKCWDLVTVGNPTYPQFLMVKPPLPILFSICLFLPNLNEENPQQFTLNITHVCSSYKNSCIRYYIPYHHHFSCVETTNQQVQPVLGHLGRQGCWPWWILCLWCLTIQQCSTQHLDDHWGYQMLHVTWNHLETTIKSGDRQLLDGLSRNCWHTKHHFISSSTKHLITMSHLIT